jgi:hypothetical protein
MPQLAEYMKINKLLVLTFAAILSISTLAFAQKQPAGQSSNLRTVDGEVVSLPSLKGKVVVIIANKLAKKYALKDVVVYWISTDSENVKSKNYASDEQLTAFGVKNKLTAKLLRDGDGAYTMKKYNIDQLPSFVILDKSGRATGEAYAGLDPENETEVFAAITEAIDSVLK